MNMYSPPLFEAPLPHVVTEHTSRCTCQECRGIRSRAEQREWAESEWEVGPNPRVNTPLPRSGPGFISSVPTSQQFGLPETIQTLQAIAAGWEHAHPGGPVLNIRDISLQGGGPMRGHKSHRQGIDVDIRPVRNDNKQGPITFRSPAYAQDLTQQLVDIIRANGILQVQFIFFNDPAIKGVRPWPNHDDHLHIRFFPPGGVPMPPSPPGQRPILRRGSRGTAVRELQTRLNTWLSTARPGLPQLVVDGIFGSRTLLVVQAYQQSQSLTVDGVVGARTWAGLLGSRVTSAAVPALIKREASPLDSTLYVHIDLGREGPAASSAPIPAMTGIFIPEDYRPQQRVDMILYLPGHKSSRSLTIDRYWHTLPLRAFREKLNDSQKNVILITPTLGLHSQAGWLVGPGGFDRYIDQVMAALTTYGPYARHSPEVGNIILASHSGGGYPMRVLAMSKQHYTPFIRECWGFDCMYNRGDGLAWAGWASSNPGAKLYNYYRSTRARGTREESEILQTQGMPNVSVVPLRPERIEHDQVPIIYWQTRIMGAPFLAAR